jgi:hypothetical protein
MIQRRVFLASPPALVLFGCSQTPSQLATDAQLIANAIGIVAPVILAGKGITPAEITAVTNAVTDIQASAVALGSALGSSGTWAAKLAKAVQVIEPIALEYMAPGSQASLAISAAVALLPLFLQVAGLAMATEKLGMTPETARLVLAGIRK